MRPIDGDVLIDKYGEWYVEELTEIGYIGTIKRIVDSMPTIEPECKKGTWIDTGSGQECSECHEIQYGYDSFRYFCAFCGADMRGESEQDE